MSADSGRRPTRLFRLASAAHRSLTARRILAMLFALQCLLASPSAALEESQILEPGDFPGTGTFGKVVDVDGDTAMVGAPFADIGLGSAQGAVYVFELDGAGSWVEVQKLVAPDGADFDTFGEALALSQDTLVVGAGGAEIGANSSQGAAYVFDRVAGVWTFTLKLETDPAIGNLAEYGEAVAIHNDTIVIGARLGNGDASGRAFVYERDEGGPDNWGETADLRDDVFDSNAQFGSAVAVFGDTVMVGALGLDLVAGTFENEGGVYVFLRDEGGLDNWGQVDLLRASDADSNDKFGDALALDAGVAIVGAFGRDLPNASSAGAAYVFTNPTGLPQGWTEDKILTASDSEAFHFFGAAVDASGDSVFAGSTSGNAGLGRGYRFNRDEGGPDNWGEAETYEASDGIDGDGLGGSIASSGTQVIVGAPFNGSNAVYTYVPEPGLFGGLLAGLTGLMLARRTRPLGSSPTPSSQTFSITKNT